MTNKEVKSIELAKELEMRPTEIVKALESARGMKFKKGTTNIKLSDEEAKKIREMFSSAKVSSKGEIPSIKEPRAEERKEEKVGKTSQIEKVKRMSFIASPENRGEIKIDDLVEKAGIEEAKGVKTRTEMKKVFQTIKRVEPKKWAEQRPGPARRIRGKFKKTEQSPSLIPQPQITAPRKKSMQLKEGTTVKEFAELIGQRIPVVIKKFMELGYMPTVNQVLDTDVAMLVADSFNVKVEFVASEQIDIMEEIADDAASLLPKPPVVTIMGHIDHGKTSLLDATRQTKVIETEAGGITQHIGAYKVSLQEKEIVFLDTPGHEAFTAMRARGAKVTDIVVLVVAADDGVMPQTVEAINHAKAANVPIVVAINKIDKPEADLSKVRSELAEYGIISEEWGGQNIFVEVSAKQKIGIDRLLEMILLQSEIMELKANPNRASKGIIIESKLDRGKGAVATVITQAGTLKVGDAFVAGSTSGKVRALINDRGEKIQSAGPAVPVEIIGFSEVPNAGDVLVCVEDERKARQIAFARLQKQRLAEGRRHKKLTLDEVYAKIKEGQIKDLNIIIKGDVQGSVKAMTSALEGIDHPAEVNVRVIHASVGGINESDVMLAAASNAIIIGFNVRPEPKVPHLAEKEGVDIRLYNIIYDAIEDIKKAIEGLLEPIIREKVIGRAEVRNIFQISRLGVIAGCYVIDGLINRASDGIRVIRNNIVAYEGKISSLKRFKEDIREVKTGYECGIMIENFNDIKVGDILEDYVIEKVAAEM
ncbi:translation initiation factor IF-2 [Thermodesulfovibrionales bacterium]|nr:translation initiation factor IF-2 [Thermodesulfovibrionales bacterium]